MDIVRGATRIVTGTANTTTAAAGAMGGAAVNGIVGGVQGALRGVRDGVSNGSHSTPAALLAIGTVGAAGLIEWPVLLAVGGTALIVRQLDGSGHNEVAQSATPARPTATATAPARSTAKKASPRRSSARKKS